MVTNFWSIKMRGEEECVGPTKNASLHARHTGAAAAASVYTPWAVSARAKLCLPPPNTPKIPWRFTHRLAFRVDRRRDDSESADKVLCKKKTPKST